MGSYMRPFAVPSLIYMDEKHAVKQVQNPAYFGPFLAVFSFSIMFNSKNNWLPGHAQILYGVLLAYLPFICKKH